jgi:hypothetical protein
MWGCGLNCAVSWQGPVFDPCTHGYKHREFFNKVCDHQLLDEVTMLVNIYLYVDFAVESCCLCCMIWGCHSGVIEASDSVPSNFFCSCADPLLLWAENFYTTRRLRGTLKVFCNMRNNICNENWKIQAAQQQFIVYGSVSVTVWLCTLAAWREHWIQISSVIMTLCHSMGGSWCGWRAWPWIWSHCVPAKCHEPPTR